MTTAARSRRSEILAAAQREFAAAGYSGARVERIAAAAAVNKQLLFHYFASKDGLFAAALADLLARVDIVVKPADSAASQLRQLQSDLLAALRVAPGLALFMADARANPRFPAPAAELLRAWHERLHGRFRAVIQDGQRRGYFRDDIEPAAVASLAVAAVIGAVGLGGPTGSAAAGFDDLLHHLLAEYCAWR